MGLGGRSLRGRRFRGARLHPIESLRVRLWCPESIQRVEGDDPHPRALWRSYWRRRMRDPCRTATRPLLCHKIIKLHCLRGSLVLLLVTGDEGTMRHRRRLRLWRRAGRSLDAQNQRSSSSDLRMLTIRMPSHARLCPPSDLKQ